MILRPYQRAAVENILACIDQAPILVSPAGSGKTHTGVAIAQTIGGRCLWVAHRKELVTQAAAAVKAAGGEVGIIMPGFTPNPAAQFQVASVQTIARRGAPACDLVVIDECHRAAAASYQNLAGPRMLGLTASPYRLDGRGLRPPFGAIVVATTVKDLVRDGYLVEPEVYAPNVPNLHGVGTRGGDYKVEALALAMMRSKLTGDIVRHWRSLASGRRTLLSCVNIEHSKSLVARFVAEGIPAEHLDGTSTNRDEVLQRLATGETLVVGQCSLLGEGWDLPALEVVVDARPTQSLSRHIQVLGRVMRICPGKRGAIVLDHASNHMRHGPVTRNIQFSLDGLARTDRKPAAWHGLGRCPKCFILLPGDWTQCPCGATRPAPVIPKEQDGALAIVVPFEVRAKYWAETEEIRTANNYRQGWSAYRYQQRFGAWPIVADGALVDNVAPAANAKEIVYLDLLRKARTKGYKDGWADYQFRVRFRGKWPDWSMRARCRAKLKEETEETAEVQ